MTLRVVLDVNTLASTAATPAGLPGFVVDCAVNGVVHLAVSDHILRKLDEVLQRPYFAARTEAQVSDNACAKRRVGAT